MAQSDKRQYLEYTKLPVDTNNKFASKSARNTGQKYYILGYDLYNEADLPILKNIHTIDHINITFQIETDNNVDMITYKLYFIWYQDNLATIFNGVLVKNLTGVIVEDFEIENNMISVNGAKFSVGVSDLISTMTQKYYVRIDGQHLYTYEWAYNPYCENKVIKYVDIYVSDIINPIKLI